MSHDLRWIAPIPPEPDYEFLETQQVTREFYQEVHHRQAFEQYCQWYYDTAQQHQQETQKMKHDFNILGWFYKGRRS